MSIWCTPNKNVDIKFRALDVFLEVPSSSMRMVFAVATEQPRKSAGCRCVCCCPVALLTTCTLYYVYYRKYEIYLYEVEKRTFD